MELKDLTPHVLYRDGLTLVLDKPAGIAVHRGPGGGSSLEDAFDSLRFGLPRAPALAHRLDRETAGCLVLGRHRNALRRLSELFKSGKVGKTYWAVTEGCPEQDAGSIELALARRDATRGWWMSVDPRGQPARTLWSVRGHASGMAWLELTPLTGRTHQLRVHCAAMGWPMLGDRVYGRPETAAPLHLLARKVALPLYPKKATVVVEAPVPAHMRNRLAALGWLERAGADPEARAIAV